MENQTISGTSNQLHMNLSQFSSSIDNSIMSNLSGDSNGSAQAFQTSAASNFLNDSANSNQSVKFWQSTASSNYLNTPNFMNNPIGNIQGTSQSQPKQLPTTNSGTMQQQPHSLQRNNSEPIVNPLTNKYSFGTGSTKNSIMNINAPSYVPSYAARTYNNNTTTSNNSQNSNNLQPYELNKSPLPNPLTTNKSNYYYNDYTYNSTNNAFINSNSELYDRSSLTNFSFNNNASTNTTITTSNTTNNNKSENDSFQEELKKLKVELIIKNQIIKNLSDQINAVNKFKSKTLEDVNVSISPSKSMKLPSNYYQLFKDLTKTLQDKTVELDETKERLEAILVSLSINNASSNNFTSNGSYDEQELTHKIINKLSLLQNENENLLKMVSFSNKSSLVIELGLLKNENKVLKEKLSKVEKIN